MGSGGAPSIDYSRGGGRNPRERVQAGAPEAPVSPFLVQPPSSLPPGSGGAPFPRAEGSGTPEQRHPKEGDLEKEAGAPTPRQRKDGGKYPAPGAGETGIMADWARDPGNQGVPSKGWMSRK